MTNTTNNWGWCVICMLSERILAQWWHPVDSCEALDLLHLAIHAILNHHIAMAIEIASNVVHVFSSLFCWLLSLWPLVQYVVSSRWMAASRGFRCCPGHHGNAMCIAPMHLHGHRNGPRQRRGAIVILPHPYEHPQHVKVMKHTSYNIMCSLDLEAILDVGI